MAILYIPQPDIPVELGWKHEATDWQLATSPAFTKDSIVAESRSDKENLLSKTFDVDLEPGKTYYARSRVICNKGIFEWSDVGIIKVQDFIKVAFNYPIPSVVMKPTVKLDFNPFNMPSTLFRIKTSEMSTTSNADHEATTYIIEDLNGEPIYINEYNKDNLTDFLLDDVILPEGKPYLLKVMHHSTSGDVSDFGTQIIYVPEVKEIVIKNNIEDVSIYNGLTIMLAHVDDFDSLEYNLYAAGIGDAENIHSGSSNELIFKIPESVFRSVNTNKFILAIKVKFRNGDETPIKYFKLTTLD